MWTWIVRPDEDRKAFANVMTDDFEGHHVVSGGELLEVITSGASFPIYAETPARAWLLAIIRAKIGELESEA